MKKKTIIISLPYTSSIKNLISDDFLDLIKDFEVIIFSCLKEKNNFFFDKLNHYGIKYFQYNKIPYLLNLLIFLINNLKTIRLMKKKKIQTLETFINMHKNKCSNEIIFPFRYLDNNFLIFLSKSKILIFFLEMIRNFMLIIFNLNYIILFLKYKPIKFFTAHPYSNVDLPLQIISNLFKLSKVCLIHSWDNLTSKFCLNTKFHKVLVWNNIQKKQLKNIYDYPDHKVKIVGVPFLDDFCNFTKESRNVFFKKNKLDIKRKLITIFGTTEEYIPHIKDIIKKIYLIILNQKLNHKAQIILRQHPTTKKNYNDLNKKKFFNIKKPPKSFIALDFKDIGNYKSDINFFINLIYHSDVIINFFSTTILDAVFFNKPIINPLIEDDTLMKKCSVSSYFYNWSHMKDIVNKKGVSVVKDYDQLLQELNRYMSNKNFKKKERKSIFNSQLNFKLGKSRVSIANEIIK